MANAKPKLINLSSLKTQLLNDNDKKYKSVFCTFTYANQTVQKVIVIPVIGNKPENYYTSEAKTQLESEAKNGKLEKYCKKYLKNNKHTTSPALKACVITCVAILGLGGVGVGAYFLGKALNPGGGGGGDKLYEVVFDADSTSEHSAYFNNDENLHKLKFSVAKGTKFGDLKKMAKDLTRVDHVDDKWGKVIKDTVKDWSEVLIDGTEVSKIADEHVIDRDLTVRPNYTRDKVTVSLIAGGNDSGYFRVSSETNPDPETLALRVFSFEINKGITLGEALNIAPPGGEVEYVKPVIIGYEDDPNYSLKCYYDIDLQKEIYIGPDKVSEELTKPVQHDITLYSIFKNTPGGAARNWMNVTFNATRPGSEQNPDLYETHYNYSGYWTIREDTIKKVTLSFPYKEESESWTWGEILTKLEGIIEEPYGIYGNFDYWEDESTGAKLENSTMCSSDIVARARYTPNFANDSWDKIIRNVNMGLQRIINAYGLENEEGIYSLSKAVAGGAAAQVIGVNTDFQDWKRIPYDYAHKIYGMRKPSALTLMLLSDPSGAASPWYRTESGGGPDFVDYFATNASYDPLCNVKWKADYLNTYLYADLKQYVNSVYKTQNSNGKPVPPQTMPRSCKTFVIGGYAELQNSGLANLSPNQSFEQTYLANGTVADVAYHIPAISPSYGYWTRYNGYYIKNNTLSRADNPTSSKYSTLIAFSVGEGSM